MRGLQNFFKIQDGHISAGKKVRLKYGRSGKVSTIHSASNLIDMKGLKKMVSLSNFRWLLVRKLAGYGYGAKYLLMYFLAVAVGLAWVIWFSELFNL